jgi:hypothetical protein
MQKEGIGWKTKVVLLKFTGDDGEVAKKSKKGASLADLTKEFKSFLKAPPDIHYGNVACNTGLANLIDCVIHATGAYWSHFGTTIAYIGAGDGNGSVPTPAATDTGLAAPTSKIYVVMDGGYPSRSAQKATFRSTFGAGVGSWYWRELGIRNGLNDSTGTLLNHLAYDKGTKAAGDTFIPSIEITFS